ncbi:hypothetical protein JRQ81_005147, partial [Phrynocephalus forsythii]
MSWEWTNWDYPLDVKVVEGVGDPTKVGIHSPGVIDHKKPPSTIPIAPPSSPWLGQRPAPFLPLTPPTPGRLSFPSTPPPPLFPHPIRENLPGKHLRAGQGETGWGGRRVASFPLLSPATRPMRASGCVACVHGDQGWAPARVRFTPIVRWSESFGAGRSGARSEQGGGDGAGRAAMDVMNMMEQPIKVTEWQQTYTYDSGIHSGMNTQVPSVSSKCLVDDDDLYGKQYTIKKTTTYSQSGAGQAQARLK